MKADDIKTIIEKLDKLPYKAILFDGAWGIGKTYAVNETLKENSNVCKISMFGLNDTKQIYHEVLFQLALKKNIAGKVGEVANNVLDGLSRIWGTIGQIKEVVHNFAEERELFLLLAKEFKRTHIIVIDDLERMSDSLNFEEVLGIIEELKQCNYIKIIIIANIELLSNQNREMYDKYNEKVIDRIYHVTERAEKVDWKKLNIHVGFITEFLKAHKVKNLRTLEKAQRFFEDVKLFCKDIKDDQFIDEIMWICFAIVVESTDNLYYKDPNEAKDDKERAYISAVSNHLEHRILNYIYRIKSSRNLMEMILGYYQNKISISTDELKAEYKIYLQAGTKPNFYRSDDEIERMLPNLEQSINQAENLVELNKFVDEYVIWSDILEKSNENILNNYKAMLHEMLEKVVLEGNEDILSYSADLFYISSQKVKDIYSEEKKNMRRFLVRAYVDSLKNSTQGKRAFDYSYKLRNCYSNSYYCEIVKSMAVELYNEKSFPLNEMNDERYHTCYNIMYILYHIDNEKFLQFCDELKLNCDKMAAHRLDVLKKEIIKES